MLNGDKKRCARCKKELFVNFFSKDRSSKDGLQGRCKFCQREISLKFRKDNPERAKEKDRNQYIRHREKNKKNAIAYYRKHKEKINARLRRQRMPRKYGISYEIYNQMLLQQNNKCAICGRNFIAEKQKKTGPQVDHDHISKKVRGLLCFNCNSMLGMAHDSIAILHSAIKYLMENNDVR